jgi:carbonic anhydrase
MLVLNYDRDYLKGFWRKKQSELPIHCFYEKYTEGMPLIVNLLTFFLPLASPDKAFRDYDSTDEILDRVDLLAATLQEGED